MHIKILGRGRCRYCKILVDRTHKAVEHIQVNVTIERIEDPHEIYSYGILATPILIIDDTVVCQGKVPPVDTLKDLILRRN